ncbi:Galectin domain-containing protein [Meloidogyne graminicola]|uniref:Galectin domain-containing protein n=1 Tax=Meloidogyne graminicola TaxID=189291 RepID=A0A8S9ZDI4_9BILA|nr:Galectin domain-containing protein [Meloidogyne graminicola]
MEWNNKIGLIIFQLNITRSCTYMLSSEKNGTWNIKNKKSKCTLFDYLNLKDGQRVQISINLDNNSRINSFIEVEDKIFELEKYDETIEYIKTQYIQVNGLILAKNNPIWIKLLREKDEEKLIF